MIYISNTVNLSSGVTRRGKGGIAIKTMDSAYNIEKN
jgi:hypothetical protein